MKNIFLIIACLGLLGSTTSCTEFLAEKPKSEMSSAQYFTEPVHAFAAVNRLYRSGSMENYTGNGVYTGSAAMWGGYIAGLYENQYDGQEVVIQYSQALTHTAVNVANEMDRVWDRAYYAIARANNIILRIPEIKGMSDADLNSYLAQAKFFRAFNYFYLVKFFGDVPLITEPYESMDGLSVPRAATVDVYALIVKDLTEAIAAGLNEVAFVDNGLRIAKGTAQILLANVYLQMSGFPLQADNYANAATVAKSIISSGKYALEVNDAVEDDGHEQQSAYNKLRVKNDSKETLYAIEYLTGISESNMVRYSLPNASSGWGILKYSSMNNAYSPREVVLNAFDPTKDLRVKEQQFWHKTYTYVKKNDEDIDKTHIVTFDDPAIWHYYNEDALLVSGKSDKDINVYRYAEVLLLAAEAIAQSGVTAEAIGYLADVQARAYVLGTDDRASIIADLTGLTKDAFIKEVWAERFRELQFDGRVWDDVQRTRKFPTTSATDRGTITFVDVVGAKNGNDKTFAEKDLLWPISANEMQRNKELVQNPGF